MVKLLHCLTQSVVKYDLLSGFSGGASYRGNKRNEDNNMKKRNKINRFFVFLVICMQITFCACGKPVNQENEEIQTKIISVDVPQKNIISSDMDFVTFSYGELKAEAAIVAKVEVLDELSPENSITNYSEEYGMVISSCAVRSVRVLEVYKSNGDLSEGDELGVQESCAVYESDGEYYQERVNDVPPLQKGGTYILFLDHGTENMSGKPSIISCNNGLVSLDQPNSNDEYFDICVKAIVEYESDIPEDEKENILQAEEIYKINPSESEKEEDITLETANGEIDISMGMKEEGNGKIGISIEEK